MKKTIFFVYLSAKSDGKSSTNDQKENLMHKLMNYASGSSIINHNNNIFRHTDMNKEGKFFFSTEWLRISY